MKTAITSSNISGAKRVFAAAFYLTLICLLAAASLGQSPPCAAVPGLVGWWRAENNAYDSASGNNGILQGGATFMTGESGQSFTFDGVDDYVEVPSSSQIEFSGPFTVEAWIKYTGSPTPGSGNVIVTKGEDIEAAQDWALAVSENGKLRPHAMVGGVWSYFDCDTTLSAGTWYHVAMVYDGTQLQGFVNGELDGAVEVSGVVQATPYPLRIGAYAPISGTWSKAMFAGAIDEVSLYNRALSAAELNSIYQTGTVGKCPASCTSITSGLVSWWQGEEDAADVISGNNGTALNGASYSAGMVGTGFEFDGVDDSVKIPYSTSFNNSAFTVETWIKPLSQVDEGQENIFAQGYGLQLCVRDWGAGMQVVFLVSDDSPQGYSEIGSSQAIPIGQYSHLAGSWDGTTLRLYINGELDGEYEPGTSLVPSECDYFIGGFYNVCDFYTGQFFHGVIDELSYYNRALTAQEIQSLHDSTTAGKCWDGDADGLQDAWERKFFGNLSQSGTDDYDEDGINNLNEYLHGTNPTHVTNPLILTQPMSQVVYEGANVTLSVTTLPAASTYQWYRNNSAISGATSASLALNGVHLADAGTYKVVVSYDGRSTASAPATLSIACCTATELFRPANILTP